MNPEEYAQKAITIEELMFRRNIDIGLAGSVVLRSGYPEPVYGVTLFEGNRGDSNGGIDWPANHLRRGIADLIRHVADDCISVINRDEGLDDDVKLRLEQAIHEHFEMIVH